MAQYLQTGGAWFETSEDMQRLIPYAWTCRNCGQKQRTTTLGAREKSMAKHAAKHA